jgi:hypothetical protein
LLLDEQRVLDLCRDLQQRYGFVPGDLGIRVGG